MQSLIPRSLMMIRPAAFGYNPQTAGSNAFQKETTRQNLSEIAVKEFEEMLSLLRAHDIDVHVFADTDLPTKSDAIFPNNWISFHPDGKVVLYPMMALSRSAERRLDIVEALKNKFKVTELIDLSYFEKDQKYLEGTGSVIFDHTNKLMYASRSDRTDEEPLKKLSEILDYRYILFNALDANGKAVYHTNVLMTLGSDFALLCLDAIPDEDQEVLLDCLAQTGHKVVAISFDQMGFFAGNMFEVESTAGQRFILMSDQAYRSLIPGQLNALSLHHELLAFKIPTIESAGGGSVRCMVAGIHLPTL